MDRYIGRLLDNRYEILEVIGTGGMAVVYKARCHRLNRLVAIKILKDENLADEEFCRRFHAESQAVAMLSHPNIVSVYDVSTTEDQDYIVMELIDGITLKQYMERRGVLSWQETIHFATRIARALEHAHSRGLVHRDIKPHNVMVLKDGSVKVADFGIARMMESNNTMTKEALGSVHYISPEQAKGRRVDNRSDIYSLGVVMYEMITGRTPYDGDSPVAVAIQHINGGAPLPSSINPGIPKGLEQIIMKAMATDLQDRYISATALLEDLDKLRNEPTTTFQTVDLPLIAEHRPELHVHRATPDEETPPRETSRDTPSRTERRDDPYEADEPKRDKAGTLAIIFCSIAAIIAIIIFMILLTEEDYLSAWTPDTAQTACQTENTPAAPLAASTETSARASESVAVCMEKLVDLSREEAAARLDALGVRNVQWTEQESSLPAGTVIAQSVAPGQTLEPTQTVRLVCAAGTQTLMCNFELPFRTQDFYLTVLLDDRPAVLERRMERGSTSVSLSLSGKGRQICRLYLDGQLYQTVTVDFDAGK